MKLWLQAGGIRDELNKLWNGLTDGQRVFAPILTLNLAVFFMWRIPQLRPFMVRHFCSNPASKTGNCMPMLLSAFSHYSLVHLGMNMFVLHSFSTPMVAAMGKEQFVGLYFSAAVMSSFASYIVKVNC